MGKERGVKISLLYLTVLVLALKTAAENDWSWSCKQQTGRCWRIHASHQNASNAGEGFLSVEACKLTCGRYSILWPKPTGHVQIGTELTHIDQNNIFFQSLSDIDLPVDTHHMVQELGKLFIQNVHANLKGKSQIAEGGRNLHVSVSIQNPNLTIFGHDIDESYELNVTEHGYSVVALIKADTYFGARHGTETLSQLIIYDDHAKELTLPSSVNIQDRPAFPYRGVLLDTARNFFSVATIRRTLDAMAASKLNTFHWHITDSQSFPMQSASFPQLTKYGAYSAEKIYTHEDIQGIIEYAKIRGIRVIPEFDVPGRVGEGWSHLSDQQKSGHEIILCFNAHPWQQFCSEPPCGQLNPTSDKVYDLLSDIYGEMAQLFDSTIFHMGGSEINIECWNSTPSVVEWMKKSGMNQSTEDFHDLWNIFQKRALERLEKVNAKVKTVMLWSSSLTTQPRLAKHLDPAKYIVHIWSKANDKNVAEVIRNGYHVVFSSLDTSYLRSGFEAQFDSKTSLLPYVSWQNIYESNPIQSMVEQNISEGLAKNLTLGQEIALWSAQVDERDIDIKLWPRAAAMAERVWSNNGEDTWKTAENRFLQHRERLVQRGFSAESIAPEWCYQHECSVDLE